MSDLKENLTCIRKCIQRRAKIEHDDYLLNRLQRWFYTLKAIVCIALNRWYDGQWDYADNYISIAFSESGSYAPPGEPTVYWWYMIEVARSWHVWHVIMSSDST